MARNITRDELSNITVNKSYSSRTAKINEAKTRGVSGSTFLSHSSKDSELVVGTIEILENHGAVVYIDEVDPEMPAYTSSETAAILKGRIKDSKRFILLTSNNSKDSRWVPWELGIADGYKGLGQLALFPVSESVYRDDWMEWEYLGLYLKIVWGKLQGYSDNVWMVSDTKSNTATELSRWLSGY